MTVAAGMGMIARQQTLYCCEGSSNKEYRLTIIEDASGFSVKAESRPRGGAWNDQGMKLQGGTREAAIKMADKTVKAKIGKGYQLVESFDRDNPSECRAEDGVPATGPVAVATSVVAEDTGFRPQLLNPIDEPEAEALLEDDRWVMEEKKDGRRHAIHLDTEIDLIGINKLGRAVPVAPKIGVALNHLFAATGGFHVDGELVGDTLFIFDLLQVGPTEVEGDLRGLGYLDRKAKLTELAANRPHAFQDGSIVVVATWEGREAKRAAYAALKAANAEGVVFKLKGAPFKAGRPNSNGDQRKFKFYATASFVVKGVNTKRSVELGLFTATGALQVMGNCTVPPNQDLPRVGNVIEVRYLYVAGVNGKVYQPCYLGLRDDVEQDECLMTQLKYKQGTGEDED